MSCTLISIGHLEKECFSRMYVEINSKRIKQKIHRENEDMSHIYQCEYLNEQELKIEYEKIFNGNLIEQTKVFFEQNMKRRNKEKLIERNPPCDPFCDPLNCGKFSIG